MPTQKVPTPITITAQRTRAASMVAGLTGLSPLTAGLLVDTVDVSTAAILGQVGLSPVEVRRVAAAIWS